MEMGAEQMTIQANYIDVLEKKIGDYETKSCQLESSQKNLWDKIWELRRALEDMKKTSR